jgi:hypothetical protein
MFLLLSKILKNLFQLILIKFMPLGKAGPISSALAQSPEAGSPNTAAVTKNFLTYFKVFPRLVLRSFSAYHLNHS